MSSPIVSNLRIPTLDESGKVPASLLPPFGGSTPTTTAVTVATGFTVPAWGVIPAVVADGYWWRFSGHIARAAADLAAGAVLATGGTWPTGRKVVAVTSTGALLLRTTASTLEIDQLLSGAAPDWVSLDGVSLR